METTNRFLIKYVEKTNAFYRWVVSYLDKIDERTIEQNDFLTGLLKLKEKYFDNVIFDLHIIMSYRKTLHNEIQNNFPLMSPGDFYEKIAAFQFEATDLINGQDRENHKYVEYLIHFENALKRLFQALYGYQIDLYEKEKV